MNRTRSFGWMLCGLMLVACLLAAGARAEAPADSEAGTTETQSSGVHRLTSVEATADGERVRVLLGADGPISARSFVLDSPDRLVLDLLGVQSAVKKSRIPVDSAMVSGVRVGQRSEGSIPVARVVLDLHGRQPYGVKAAPGGLLVTVGEQETEAGSEPLPIASRAEEPVKIATLGASGGAPDSSDAAASAPSRKSPAPTPAGYSAAPAAAPTPASPAGVSSTTAALRPPASSVPAGAPSTSAAARAPASTAPGGASATPAAVKPAVGGIVLPQAASPAPASGAPNPTFETRTISQEKSNYTGKKISLNLVDADVKQVFRLFHEISGLNFVLDPGVSGNVTVVLDEVPWDQALDLILKNNGLDKVYENNVVRIASTQKLATEAGGRKALKEAKELEAEPVTITRRLSYAKAKDVDSIVKTGVLLSQRGKSFFDDRTNTLIITDVPTKIDPLDRLLTALDDKTPQVMIEARIVLTGRDFLQDLGIDWGFTVDRNPPHSPIGPEFPNRGDVSYNLNLPRQAAANKLAFNFFNKSGSFNLNIALDALESDGKSRTISAPRIATQNNVKAEIEQGVQIPFASSTATEVNVQFVSASLKLSVTPQITAENTVVMDILVENNQPSKTVSSTTGVPGIDTQRALTKVMVDDGGTTVIGGIFEVAESTNETGVPWFRKIPVFGWLFKSRSVTAQNRELLIFITPKILRDI